MGSDRRIEELKELSEIFQSTLPAWGATCFATSVVTPTLISIHAPRMGSDKIFVIWRQSRWLFQSTLPAWGATPKFAKIQRITVKISIHAPRMGSDLAIITIALTETGFQSTLPAWGATWRSRSRSASLSHFNPRSPHGERRLCTGRTGRGLLFQSTLPAWGATF